MKNNKIKILVIIAIVVFIASGLITLAINSNQVFKPKHKPKRAKVSLAQPNKNLKYDTVLLNTLTLLVQKVNGIKVGTFSGYITIINPQDTSKNLNHLPFSYAKNNLETDYIVGQAEVLNANGQNLFVNHESKSIMLTEQQNTSTPFAINTPFLIKSLQAGDYKLITKSNGHNKTISIVNEGNLDCKEYSLTYDTVKMQITRIYSRKPDINDPFNKALDQVIDISINTSSTIAHINHNLLTGDVVYKNGDNWKLSLKYASYQLIQP